MGWAYETHGLSDSILYSRWIGMRNRCYYTKGLDYPRYGGVGVTICEEWRNDFKAFYDWSMNNGFNPDLQIDKDILCDKLGISPKIYSPSTCQWITREENLNYARKDLGVQVAQYGLNGALIAVFNSITEASEHTGIEASNISRASRGLRDTAGDYLWYVVNDSVENSVPAFQIDIKGKPVLQLDKTTGKVLAEFPNSRTAAEFLGKSNPSPIQQVCNKTKLPSGNCRVTAYGYKWAFYECHRAVHSGVLPMKKSL